MADANHSGRLADHVTPGIGAGPSKASTIAGVRTDYKDAKPVPRAERGNKHEWRGPRCIWCGTHEKWPGARLDCGAVRPPRRVKNLYPDPKP